MITAKSINKGYLTQMDLGVEGVKPVYADQPKDLGGMGEDMRPGQLLLSGYAACINITVRRMLNEEGLSFDEVNVYVDMDNSEKGVSKFYSKVDIIADIPQAKKDEIIEKVKSCAVCNILSNEKVFLDLE